jgi:hypothetical protein
MMEIRDQYGERRAAAELDDEFRPRKLSPTHSEVDRENYK